MFDLFNLSEILTKAIAKPDVAPTPSEVVYTENRLRVLRYIPKGKHLYKVPLIIVNSLVNKYYILDLMPGKSYVEFLVKQGFDVYMLDWGVPEEEDSIVTLDDHINRYLVNVVAAVLEKSGAKKVSIIGYCMGGTMALMYASLHKRYLKNLLLLATPIDFDNESTLSLWGKRENFDVDKFVDTYGNVPVEVLKSAFMMLKPLKNITKYVDLLENMHNQEYVKTFLAFDYWVNDSAPVPGETFRDFMKATYQTNSLIDGKMKLGRRAVKLENITCSLLNVVAEHDDIVPLSSSTPIMNLVRSKDKELLQVKGGHHGLSIGPSAIKTVWPKSAEWLSARS
ncbi:MAG: class III poly(R)-hydroxyalkanoic acid synthase subunit PhaC [Blastocatellia bacterium]|nr:class III poly(R)-hydroxyalkanoic acid synthase subunit PhaC [Blastocatellia bacterium]